jgi:N6-adenosine-specific RNA methylase IME4
MFDLSNSNDDIIAQLLVAQRMLSDVSARLVREADEPAREAARREDPTPRSFGYTNSLEGLIQSGKQYGTIYAEPPWPCDDAPTQQHGYRRPQLPVDAIAALPIGQLAAPSSHLHIWTTDRFLRDAMQIIEAWGFAYKGSLVWICPELGNGDYWGIGHQYLLLGVRGSAPFSTYRPRSWFFDARHSVASDVKPYVIAALIKQISPYPRLHLFNESVTDGWTTWGQRVPSYSEEDDEDDWGPDDADWCEIGAQTREESVEANPPLLFDASNDKPTGQVES